jgi:uncharacterized membrane protein (UPF0127 family)
MKNGKQALWHIIFVFCIFFVFSFSGCAADSAKQNKASKTVQQNIPYTRAQEKLETKNIIIENQAGQKITVCAELARTMDQQARGLMFRKTLQDGDGMLFVYTHDEMLSFWMKNTIIPLSIAFINHEGRIIDIFDMRPQSTISVKSTRSARYALETPQGFFERSGIAVGDIVQL